MSYLPYWYRPSWERDEVYVDQYQPLPAWKPSECRCPNCGCLSLVNHCWWLFLGTDAVEYLAPPQMPIGPKDRTAVVVSRKSPSGTECRDWVCFVCRARVSHGHTRIWLDDIADAPLRCCRRHGTCEYYRAGGGGSICVP